MLNVEETAMKAVKVWLDSGPGRARIRKEMQAVGLPPGLDDDLAQEAAIRALRYMRTGQIIVNPAAFLTEALMKAAIDMGRGRRAWGGHQERLGLAAWAPGDESGTLPEPSAAAAGVEELVLAADNVERLRHHVHRRLAGNGLGPRPDPKTAGAAFALLVLSAEDPFPTRRCPQPEAGAAPGEDLMWAALWFGGQTDCFPEGAPEVAGPTLRQRRSRAGGKVRELLGDAPHGAAPPPALAGGGGGTRESEGDDRA